MNYYRKSLNKTANDVKLKMQMGSLILKTTENINKINDLVKVDEDIKKDVSDNLNLINSNKENISKKVSEIYKKELLITSNNSSIYGHKKRLDVIEEDIKNTDVTNLKNDIKNNSANITKNYNINQINKKKSEFYTDLIDNHTNTLKNIKDDIEQINSNIYVPTSKYIIENIHFYKLDSIKEFDFSADTKKLLVHEIIINDDLRKDGYIELIESILYKFDNIKTSYYILKEKYQFLDKNDNVLDEFYFNIVSKGFIFYNIHIFKNAYHYKITKDIDYLKVRLYLERISQTNVVPFNLKLTSEYQSNYICLKYLKNNI